MKWSTILFSILVLAACSSTTTIRSSDPEARIYVNGEYIGTGVADYTDRKVAFSNNDVVIRREGCAPRSFNFRRNEDPEAGAIFTGLFLTVPFLWVTEYKDEHAYEYDCDAPVDEQAAGS
jgi:hypothetical protein